MRLPGVRYLITLCNLLIGIVFGWWLFITLQPIIQSKLDPAPNDIPLIQHSNLKTLEAQSKSDEQTPIDVLAFHRNYWPLSMEIQGIVKSAQEVTLVTEAQGKVVEVHPAYKTGEPVAAGTVLVRLATPRFEAQLAAAKSQLWQARQSLQQLQAQLSAAGEVPGLKTPTAYRESLLAVQESAVEAALSELKLAQEQADSQALRAPFAGVFAGSTLSIGQNLPQGLELGRFYSHVKLALEISLNARDLNLVQASTDRNQIEAVVAKRVGEHQLFFDAQLQSQTGIFDPVTGLTRLQLKFETGVVLVPGERVLTRLSVPSGEPLLRLPLEFVQNNAVLGVIPLPEEPGYARVVRHQLTRVLSDREYGYFKFDSERLYVVKHAQNWIFPGNVIPVSTVEQGV